MKWVGLCFILALLLTADGTASTDSLVRASPDIIYVDGDATGLNDGKSWADAFNHLQDALAVAETGDENMGGRGRLQTRSGWRQYSRGP